MASVMLIGTRRGDLGGRSINPCCNTDSVPAIGLEGLEESEEKIAEEQSPFLLGSYSICGSIGGRGTAVFSMYNTVHACVGRVCLCVSRTKRSKVPMNIANGKDAGRFFPQSTYFAPAQQNRDLAGIGKISRAHVCTRNAGGLPH